MFPARPRGGANLRLHGFGIPSFAVANKCLQPAVAGRPRFNPDVGITPPGRRYAA